jgi:hypothetical protein
MLGVKTEGVHCLCFKSKGDYSVEVKFLLQGRGGMFKIGRVLVCMKESENEST